MRIFFLSLTLIITFILDANCQIEYGVKTEIGASKFSKTFFSRNSKTRFELSWNLGVYFNKNITNKFSLGISPNFGRFKSTDRTHIQDALDNNGMVVGVSKSGNTETLHHYNFPFSISYRIKKLQFNAGAMVSLIAASKSRNYGESILNGQPFSYQFAYENLNINFMNYGIFSSINYKFHEYISLGIAYHHGFNNQLKNNSIFTWRARQISFEFIIPVSSRN